MKPFLPAAMLAALLCGCATQGPPSPNTAAIDSQSALVPSPLAPNLVPPEPTGSSQVVQMAPLPGVTGPVNGIYQGRERPIEVNGPSCPPPQLGLVEIGDGTLLFPYADDQIYVVPIPPTGLLHATMGDASLDGQLVDGNLDFNITTPTCKSSFAFTRRSGF